MAKNRRFLEFLISFEKTVATFLKNPVIWEFWELEGKWTCTRYDNRRVSFLNSNTGPTLVLTMVTRTRTRRAN
jgi:hypothetical protein